MRLAPACNGRSHHGRRLCCCSTANAALLLLLLCCCSSERLLVPKTTRQCLYLDDSVGPEEVCEGPLIHVRLRFCDDYALGRLLAEGALCDGPCLARLRGMDHEARRAVAAFRRLLDRYDCDTANSVSWTCKDCEEAYKQWVCSMYLPAVVLEGQEVKPCRYICRLVEQRCPYFHPSVKEQYAGERVFKCIDPDIPDLDSIQNASSYGPPGSCYCPQHLDAGEDSKEEECHLLSPLQHKRITSRYRGHRSEGVTKRPSSLLVALLNLATWLSLARWTRTR